MENKNLKYTEDKTPQAIDETIKKAVKKAKKTSKRSK